MASKLPDAVKGMCGTVQGQRDPNLFRIIDRLDARGKAYYWIVAPPKGERQRWRAVPAHLQLNTARGKPVALDPVNQRPHRSPMRSAISSSSIAASTASASFVESVPARKAVSAASRSIRALSSRDSILYAIFGLFGHEACRPSLSDSAAA